MMNSSFKNYSPEEHFLGVCFFLSILLPHNSILYLANPILLLILGNKYNASLYRPQVCIVLVFLLFISTAWNFLAGVPIDTKSIIRIVYISELLLFFPFCPSTLRIPSFYIIITASIILVSQLCCLFGIAAVSSIFDHIYPYGGEDFSLSSEGQMYAASMADSIIQIQDVRFGGLFHNSNQLMKYISLCGIVYCLENENQKLIHILPALSLFFICAFLAGSRTGFFILILAIVLWYEFKTHEKTNFKLLIIGFLCLLIVYLLLQSLFPDMRILKLEEGSHDSIGTKFTNLKLYWNRIDNIRALTVGNAANAVTTVRYLYGTPFSMFDSEWGDIIYSYGPFFLVFYCIFLGEIFVSLKGIYKIAFLCLLWIISSTVLCSFRTSFAFFFILSKYYLQSRSNL